MDNCLCHALLSLSLLMYCVIHATSIHVSSYKRQTPGNTFDESLSLKLGQQRGTLACSQICSGTSDGDCLGFISDKNGTKCELLLKSKYGSSGAKLTSRPGFVQYNDPDYPVIHQSCDELSKEDTPPSGPVSILTPDGYVLEVYCRQHGGAGVWYTFPSAAAIRDLYSTPGKPADTSLFFTDHTQFLLVLNVQDPSVAAASRVPTQGSVIIKQYQETHSGTSNLYINIPFELSFNIEVKDQKNEDMPYMHVMVTPEARVVEGSTTGLNINGQDSVYLNSHHHQRGFTLFGNPDPTNMLGKNDRDFTHVGNVALCSDVVDTAQAHPLPVPLPDDTLMLLAMDMGHEKDGAKENGRCYTTQNELDNGRVVSGAIGFF